VVTAQLAVDRDGVDGPARPDRRPLKPAVSIAIGTVALGAVVALAVGALESQILAPAAVPVTSVRGLPGDLFTAPRAPKPRIVLRYTAPQPAPRPAPSAPAAATPAATAQTAPTAVPTPTHHHPSPSPSPSPSGGGDD
jgi:hypothetical protein